MPEDPRIAVVLLVYNHAQVVGEAISSILAQTHGDFTLFISDDCSTDDTAEVVASFAQRDARIVALRTPRNLGMAANANFAVSHAKSELIALLHHDDVYAPTLLERWADVMTRHPSVGFVSNAYANHGRTEIDQHPFDECTEGRLALERYMLPNWGCPVRGTAMIRKRCWDSVGGMRERFGMLADVDLWMRLSARYDVGYVREPLITVRHARPADYPGAYFSWSWPRMRLAYEIYGQNYLDHYGRETLHGRFQQAVYRVRMNTNIARWLTYAILKRKPEMLATSDEVANAYEFTATKLARRVLRQLAAVRSG